MEIKDNLLGMGNKCLIIFTHGLLVEMCFIDQPLYIYP